MPRASVFSWLRTAIFPKGSQTYGPTKRDFYESRLYLQNLQKLSKTINLDHLAGLTTEKTVTFYGIKFGYSLKEAVSKLGKPNYKTSEQRLFEDHKIIFYRLKIATVNCILQLHFLNDSFFLGVIEMRTGDKKLKERLFDLIQQKYKIEKDLLGNVIRDDNGNQIHIREDVVPYVIYCSGDEQIRRELLDLLHDQKPEMARFKAKQKDLLLDMI